LACSLTGIGRTGAQTGLCEITALGVAYVSSGPSRSDRSKLDRCSERPYPDGLDGGDPLQVTCLFGISDPTAVRYCAGLG
jgi:hypothetical protein